MTIMYPGRRRRIHMADSVETCPLCRRFRAAIDRMRRHPARTEKHEDYLGEMLLRIYDRYDVHLDSHTARLERRSTMTKRRRCECKEPNCPVHGGDSCSSRAIVRLRRIDSHGEPHVEFCDECAAEAVDSGMFELNGPR